jgi:hypothetical protein
MESDVRGDTVLKNDICVDVLTDYLNFLEL